MIAGIFIGLLIGATFGVLIIGVFTRGKIEDAYVQGRLDELADRFWERAA